MRSSNPWRITQTSSWRLTLFFSILMLFITVSVIAVIYHFSLGQQDRYLKQKVIDVSVLFTNLALTDSLDKTQFIEALQQQSHSNYSMVLVLEDLDTPVGDLSLFPEKVAAFPETSTFYVAIRDRDNDLEPEPVLGTLVQTPFGRLLVGTFYGVQTQLKERFLTTSSIVVIVSLMLSLLTGSLFSKQMLSRIKTMNRELDAIQSGQLEARLSLSKRGDELDLLTGKINTVLDEIDSLIGSLVSVTDNIAHDLRTPISRIRVRLEDCLQQIDSRDKIYPQLQPLLVEIDHIVDTFNAMLELSRLEKGAMQTQKQPCELAQIAEDVASLIEPLATEKLHFHIEIAEDRKTVIGDPHLLFRAIYNIVDNAIRYTPAGGHVEMKVSETRVTVNDNGPGIPKKNRERIFQRLTRLDESRQTEGNGLGLAIVQAIVKRHHGTITLSDNSPGLSISLDFPASPSANII